LLPAGADLHRLIRRPLMELLVVAGAAPQLPPPQLPPPAASPGPAPPPQVSP
jgi:hypothetical protein